MCEQPDYEAGHFIHLEQSPSIWWPRNWARAKLIVEERSLTRRQVVVQISRTSEEPWIQHCIIVQKGLHSKQQAQ
ncbi:hypothetical protein, partial [Paraburkholderia atlantica]|uniref:hypothetical protein n=1 Tax=Paraburkholderia atlantica TaxID=2654982 RepID=UPI0016108CAD